MSWFDNLAKTAARRSAVDDQSVEPTSGLTRRDALKKAGIVGGAALWMTPVIQTIAAPHAAASPPPQGTCSAGTVPGSCGTGNGCTLCASGQVCAGNGDCVTGNCTGGFCQDASPPSGGCLTNADCTSNTCNNGTCGYGTTGTTCAGNTDCGSNNCAGTCQASPATGSGACQSSSDCLQDPTFTQVCVNNVCKKTTGSTCGGQGADLQCQSGTCTNGQNRVCT